VGVISSNAVSREFDFGHFYETPTYLAKWMASGLTTHSQPPRRPPVLSKPPIGMYGKAVAGSNFEFHGAENLAALNVENIDGSPVLFEEVKDFRRLKNRMLLPGSIYGKAGESLR
jgi:hypothetical protein